MSVAARELDPMSLIGAALSLPAVSLVLALIIAAGIVLFASRGTADTPRGPQGNARSVHNRYAPERRTLGVVALVVIVGFTVEFVVRGYALPYSELVHWWRFALPLAVAAVGLAIIVGLIATRGSTRSESPVISGSRRTWSTFSSRPALISTLTVGALLASTTVLAGLASSPNGEGRYVWLTIPIPNEPAIDPIRLPFYGWTYGLPVLVCLVTVGVLWWATLDRNAARPFLRPETVSSERIARRNIASGATRIATATMLLALTGAWRLIADAGSGSSLTIIGQNGDAPYDASWRYAELATVAGWCAPILEVTALVLLLLVIAASLRRSVIAREPSTDSTAPINAEALR
ncbi:hypothetical protein ACWKWN_06025 [Microbacterium trichothecenolyticum]